MEAKRELNDQLSQSQQDRAAAVEANSGQGSNRRAPEKVIGYSCVTEHSYQLRHRAQLHAARGTPWLHERPINLVPWLRRLRPAWTVSPFSACNFQR